MKYLFLIMALGILLTGCKQKSTRSDAYGNFEADPKLISSENSGKLLLLRIEKGQNVDSGFVAAVIDSTQLHLKLNQLEAQKRATAAKKENIRAQINVLEQQITNLAVDKNRVEKMVADEAATQKQLDDITGQMKVLNRQVESIRSQYSTINQELEVLESQQEATEDLIDRCTVVSPIQGTILETYIEEGELASSGRPLFKIANLDYLILKAYISGKQLSDIKLGQEVQVLTDNNDSELHRFRGEVVWISPEAEFTPKIIQTREERVKLVYAVKIKVKNDGTLKIGMPGEMRLL